METMGEYEVKERELMYRLMISQLFYDGHQQIAVNLAKIVQPSPACPPSDRLYKIVSNGFKSEQGENGESTFKTHAQAPVNGIDLEYETDVQTLSPEAALYETCYVTAHKAGCRAATYHHSGQLIATGSEDCSIKILDVDRMLAKSDMPAEAIAAETQQQMMENHPVIRTLYDHTAEVTCLDFHPFHQILASGSTDYSVRFFEFSKPSVKKAFKSIQEASPVRCINFHPGGDYLLVGTEHPTLRLYNITTFECYVAANPKEQHRDAVTAVKYSPNGAMYVSSSRDGDIKIWDSVSNKCINTFKRAHDGAEVTSVVFSRNSKYVLSSGMDSLVKLWELCTHRCLIAYTGAGATGKQENDTKAVFNHTEDYVFYPDEKTLSLCCWDSRNAERQKLLNLGHNSTVRAISHSPTGPSFVTCSDDFRARFWVRKAASD